MRNKRRTVRICCGILLMGFAFFTGPGPGARAAGEPYTYQAVFHAGVQGTFRGTDEVRITPADPSSGTDGRQAVLSGDGKTITVTGLRPGDRLSFDVALTGSLTEGENTPAVQLADGSRYYVKGLLKSGRDGKDPLDSAMPSGGIREDLDYTVSYGIRGDMTFYRVSYQDASGRELAPGRKYSGNVGDRPVAAYLYIEGYQPQAYNLTKTLVKNEAENELTFVYTPVERRGAPGETVGETETRTASNAPGTEAEVEIIETEETAAAPGAPAVQGTPGETGEGEQAAGGEEIPDGQAPEGPAELLDLDDEEVPMASGEGIIPGGGGDAEAPGGGVMYGLLAVAAAGVVIMAGAFVWLWKGRKKEEES